MGGGSIEVQSGVSLNQGPKQKDQYENDHVTWENDKREELQTDLSRVQNGFFLKGG